MFYYFTEKRQIVERYSMMAGLVTLVVLTYVKLNHTLETVKYLGVLCCIGSVVMFGAPLASLVRT